MKEGLTTSELTLELDVGGEWREVRGLERAALGYMIGRKRTADGEVG